MVLGITFYQNILFKGIWIHRNSATKMLRPFCIEQHCVPKKFPISKLLKAISQIGCDRCIQNIKSPTFPRALLLKICFSNHVFRWRDHWWKLSLLIHTWLKQCLLDNNQTLFDMKHMHSYEFYMKHIPSYDMTSPIIVNWKQWFAHVI